MHAQARKLPATTKPFTLSPQLILIRWERFNVRFSVSRTVSYDGESARNFGNGMEEQYAVSAMSVSYWAIEEEKLEF